MISSGLGSFQLFSLMYLWNSVLIKSDSDDRESYNLHSVGVDVVMICDGESVVKDRTTSINGMAFDAGVVFFDVVAKDSCRSLPQIAFKVQRIASKVGEFVEIVGETDDTELATIVFFSAPASEVVKTKVVSGRQGLADVDDFWVVRNVITLDVDESGSAEVSWIFRGWRTLYWW